MRNPYIIHQNWDLSYDIDNTINEHNQRPIHYLSSIPKLFLVSLFEWFKKKFIFFYTSSLVMISLLSLFECISYTSSFSSEEMKLLAIVNWIFGVLDFVRLFTLFFKYILFLSKYSSTNSFLFLSTLHSCSI